jgi:hypothetical protein
MHIHNNILAAAKVALNSFIALFLSQFDYLNILLLCGFSLSSVGFVHFVDESYGQGFQVLEHYLSTRPT